ncbi:MAG: helix-turn-helix transcriptional regulator [Roseivirga sp.]|nr:helix-turn-helix transcriptional regulator [Roseivirga sp.]
MMEFQPISLNLVAAGILFGILQIAFLLYFFLRKKASSAHRVLALFLLALLWAQIESFLNHSGLMARVPHLLNTATPLIFLFGPILLLHTNKQLDISVSLWSKIIHLIPFVLYFGYSFFFFLQPEAYKYNAFVRSFQPDSELLQVSTNFDMDPLNIQGLVVVELLSLHMILYSVYSLYLTRTHKNHHAAGWLQFTNATLLLGGVTLLLSQGGVVNGYRFFNGLLPNFSADLFPTFATYAISFYVLKNGLVSKIRSPKYYKSSIAKELKHSQVSKIKKSIEDEKVFLRPDFSLQLLAETCNLSTHHVSQILNEEMGCTFFELTNKYRIEEAKTLLSKPEDHFKMEQLAYDLGYKSKSTFFNAFKRETNTTPSKYRQLVLK